MVDKIVLNPSSSLSIVIVSITWHSFKSFESINHLISLKSITYEIVVFNSFERNITIFFFKLNFNNQIHMFSPVIFHFVINILISFKFDNASLKDPWELRCSFCNVFWSSSIFRVKIIMKSSWSTKYIFHIKFKINFGTILAKCLCIFSCAKTKSSSQMSLPTIVRN